MKMWHASHRPHSQQLWHEQDNRNRFISREYQAHLLGIFMLAIELIRPLVGIILTKYLAQLKFSLN